METKRILLVEDDVNLGTVIKDFLEMEGYSVTHCVDGKKGQLTFLRNKFNLVIIDIMLPLLDGFSLAKFIRKQDETTPIIFLSAKSMYEDKIRGFKLGADDYITKPFSTEELLLRINALFRRTNGNKIPGNNSEIYTFGIFEFNYSDQLLKTDNTHVQLTNKESEVLRMLCIYKNRLLKREIALKEIWGENDYFMGRSMDVYIAKLRKLLRDDPTISIVNVHNAGFKLLAEER
jgi:DNA-binding response OmpR family regulator